METSRLKRVLLTVLHPKVGIPLIVLLLVLSAPLIFRARQIAGLPDPGDPFDVEAFGTVEIAPEENAFVEYKSASATLVPFATTEQDDPLTKAMKDGWPAASEEVRKWLAENRAVLETWREGTQKPDALYHQPKDLGIETLLPVVQNLREFARLARLEGLRLEDTNDPDGAREWYRAIFRSSRHSGKHGMVIERLVGMALHGIAAEAIEKWAARPDVDAAQLRRALDDVTADYQMTPATSTTLKAEYVCLRNTLDRTDLSQWVDSYTGPSPAVKPLMFLMHEPELSQRVFRHVWANWLSEVDRPLHARSPRHSGTLSLFTGTAAGGTGPDSLSPAEIEKFFHRSVLARILLPALTQFDVAVFREQARQRTLVVALAAQLFYRKHGRFPEKAEELLPGILKELPQDPFGKSGESIHYRRDGDDAIVWSIGLNGTDDGGTISDNHNMGDIGYQLHPPGRRPAESASEQPR